MSDKTKAILAIIFGSFLGGAVSAVTKIGLVNIPPFTFSLIRFCIASLCLLPLLIKSGVKINKEVIPLVLVSLLPVLNVVFFVLGVKTTTASIAQMLYGGTPILAGIFSFIILKNKLTIKRWIFLIFGLFGVAFVVLLPLIEKNKLYAGDLKGNVLIAIGVLFWSIYFVLSKQYQKKYSPIVITSIFVFVAIFVFSLLSIFEIQSYSGWINNIKLSGIYAILYVAIFGTVAGYLLNQYAIKFSNPVIASLSFYLQPIFAYLSAFILLGEKLTSGLIIGTIIVLISVALTTYSK